MSPYTMNMKNTPEGEEIRIYLCARVSKDAHEWNDKVSGTLRHPFIIFKPHENSPGSIPHEEFPKKIFEKCLVEMKRSDMCLLLPPYGIDCAWEVGWYANSEKPLVVFVDDNLGWLRDWMVKGGINHVITTNMTTFEMLGKDPVLESNSVIKMKKMSDLPKELLKIYKVAYHDEPSV